MIDMNGRSGEGHAAVTADRPVVLIRYRAGVVGETARTVHIAALATGIPADTVGAVCGAVLRVDGVEVVSPGEGMPCVGCVLHHAKGTTSAPVPIGSLPDSAGLAEGGVAYQEWGWPVICHGDRVGLKLDPDVSALAIPVPLCVEVTQILIRQRCPPAVLFHPYAPEHRIVIVGEGYGMTLPWPAQVHNVTGVLLLPPTITPRGPITWAHPARSDSLSACREIDLFGALHTALSDSLPESCQVTRPEEDQT